MRFRLTDRVRYRVFDSEGVVLDLATDRCYGLNGVAARILRALAAGDSPAAIVARLVERYEIEPEPCRRELARFLGELEALGLGAEVPE